MNEHRSPAPHGPAALTPRAGDPAKAAKVLLDMVEAENPPVHLILGGDALQLVRNRTAAFLAELDAWKDVSHSTDFD